MHNLKNFIKRYWHLILIWILFVIIIVILLSKKNGREQAFYREAFLFDPDYPNGPESESETGELGFDTGVNSNKSHYSIPEALEKELNADSLKKKTLETFKSLFDETEFAKNPICDYQRLVKLAKGKGILVLSNKVTHTMEFNHKRVIVEVSQQSFPDPKCPMYFKVESIG